MKMEYPKLSEETRLSRLSYPEKKIRIVMDTDTFNEVDDQFAVVYALESEASGKFHTEAFYAAPFHNHLASGPEEGMEKSYQELQKVLTLMNRTEVPIYRGSDAYLPAAGTPVFSAAARDLVERALAAPEDDPLYVIAIGAITNVASAILLNPEIIRKMVVVWLGGHALHWPDTKEFNLFQDLYASRVVLDSGVPLTLIPCQGVASHLSTTPAELRENIKECGETGSYLYETFTRYQEDTLDSKQDKLAYSKIIWDLAPIGYLNNKDWLPASLVHAPLLSEDFRWSFDSTRHFIRYVHAVNRDRIFGDLFSKLKEKCR